MSNPKVEHKFIPQDRNTTRVIRLSKIGGTWANCMCSSARKELTDDFRNCQRH